MGDTKKIVVSLPDNLLGEVDEMVILEKKNRSEFIREAMKFYIKEKSRMQIREMMEKGYKEMAHINSELTESSYCCDKQVLEEYEWLLSGRR